MTNFEKLNSIFPDRQPLEMTVAFIFAEQVREMSEIEFNHLDKPGLYNSIKDWLNSEAQP